MSLNLLPIWLFLMSLLFAPQLWWGPILNWRVDLMIYPLWMLVLGVMGRLGAVFSFKAQDRLFLLMFVWIVLSVFVNGYDEVGQTYITYYFKLFLLLRLVSASISGPAELRGAGYALLMVALLIAVQAIQHMHNPAGLGWAGQSYAWIDGEAASQIGLKSRLRWVGIFDGPGVFCVMFTAAIPFAFQYMAAPYSMFKRLLAAAILTFPLLLAAFYTGSRGGILATAAMVGMFLISRFKISLSKLILAAAIGAVALMAAPSYLTSTKDSNRSAQGRVDMWAKGLGMVENSPLFGVGKGRFVIVSGRLVAHNSGLEVMGETGFPGIFAWVAIIYMGFKHLIFRLREATDINEKQTLLAVMMSLTGYLISSLFVTIETEFMYFILGLTAAVARWTEQPIPFGRKDVGAIAAIVIVYYVAFKIFVMGYY